MVKKTLKGLPDTRQVAVFRALELILRDDPTLKATVQDWRTGEGQPSDRQPFAPTKVGVRMWPVPGPEAFWTPESMTHQMFVMFDLSVPGQCVDDVANLWGAICRALYPLGGQAARQANIKALQKAGAHTGISVFSAPAIDPSDMAGADGHFTARGTLRIEVRDSFDTP